MLICVKCKREMRCVKTGAHTHYGFGHVYAGDAFECPGCGAHIIHANDRPYRDEGYEGRDYYLEIRND